MNITFRALCAALLILIGSPCISFAGGQQLLDLAVQPESHSQKEVLSISKKGVADILDGLGIAGEARTSFDKLAPKSVVTGSKPLKFNQIENNVVLTKAKTSISAAKNSIIISQGPLHISHSENNVIICESDVDITIDGDTIHGSLIVSKGKISMREAGKAGTTYIYAAKGAGISTVHHAKAFNTTQRKSAHGTISNTIVTPLFLKKKGAVHAQKPATALKKKAPAPLPKPAAIAKTPDTEVVKKAPAPKETQPVKKIIEAALPVHNAGVATTQKIQNNDFLTSLGIATILIFATCYMMKFFESEKDIKLILKKIAASEQKNKQTNNPANNQALTQAEPPPVKSPAKKRTRKDSKAEENQKQDTPAQAPLKQCPKCLKLVTGDIECEHCGVIFEKYYMALNNKRRLKKVKV